MKWTDCVLSLQTQYPNSSYLHLHKRKSRRPNKEENKEVVRNHNNIDKEMVKMMLTYTAEGKFKFSWLFKGENNLPKYLSSS